MAEPYKPPQVQGLDIWSIDDIEEANRRAGYHFFSRSAQRFFNSRILSDVFVGPGGIHFVTSERQEGFLTGIYYQRQYTARRLRDDGGIDTLGDFNALPTAHLAKKIARLAAAGIVAPGDTVPGMPDRYHKVTCATVDCGATGSAYEMIYHKPSESVYCVNCAARKRTPNPKPKEVQS